MARWIRARRVRFSKIRTATASSMNRNTSTACFRRRQIAKFLNLVYNTHDPMTRLSSALLALTLALALFPVSALAADLPEPEDFLIDGTMFLFHSKRAVIERAREQRLETVNTHPSTLKEYDSIDENAPITASDDSEADPDSTHEAAPDEEEGPTLDLEEEYPDLEPETIRLLNRL